VKHIAHLGVPLDISLYMRYSLTELYQKRLGFGTKRHSAISLETQTLPCAKIPVYFCFETNLGGNHLMEQAFG
jgi:hypothetical protein